MSGGAKGREWIGFFFFYLGGGGQFHTLSLKKYNHSFIYSNVK